MLLEEVAHQEDGVGAEEPREEEDGHRGEDEQRPEIAARARVQFSQDAPLGIHAGLRRTPAAAGTESIITGRRRRRERNRRFGICSGAVRR